MYVYHMYIEIYIYVYGESRTQLKSEVKLRGKCLLLLAVHVYDVNYQ